MSIAPVSILTMTAIAFALVAGRAEPRLIRRLCRQGATNPDRAARIDARSRWTRRRLRRLVEAGVLIHVSGDRFYVNQPALIGYRRGRRLRAALLVALLLFAGLSTWTLWIEPASLRTREVRLELPTWPAAANGLRMAVIADLHVGAPFNGLDRLEEVVELAGRSQPDVILLAGDYVIHGVLGGEFILPEPIAARLGALSAPLGVYAVLGNHDWWFDGERVQRALESEGIIVLEDEARELATPATSIWLAGVSDYYLAPHDVRAALAPVPEEAPVIVLTHTPDIFPQIPDRVALTVAGHTHGGQIRLPFIGPPVVPSRFGQRYASGLIVEGGRTFFVSPGVGTSILPVRFWVPPEITVLELHRAADQPF